MNSNKAVKRPPTSRARVSNGSKLLANVDGRSLWARRYRDVYDALIVDAGGADMVSEATSVILRRAATLATELERIESGFAVKGAADPADLDLFARVSGTLTRLLERVGIERKPRDITPPSLESYIASRAAAVPTCASDPPAAPLPPIPPIPAPVSTP